MTEMSFQFTGHQVTGNNTSCFSINHNHIQHFMTGIHFYISQCHLSFQCLVSTDQ